ncbi:NitT/TauT family transport system substrate-binding protein [Azospirillum agricola]|uniref:ABC transporter substrate-binding protein n=1 Tax=Azospirillum agricola TaxID=1720247 RepID=UPI001AE34862|nr:ABC transporter substrate-binding protein [Azospirillum agricola]MBP2231916.1 NitT/TauT family transport system substrate-binding protein [Azospirillum agricola]
MVTRRLLLGGAAATIAGASWPVRSATGMLRRLRIGTLRPVSSAPLFLGHELGYFADLGFESELVFFDAAQPIAVAAASGDIDLGCCAFTGGLFNLAGNRALTVVAGGSPEAPGYPLVGYLAGRPAHEAGLKTLRDFPGRTVGITQIGSSYHYSMHLLARKHGFDLAQVRLQPLQSLSNMAAALTGGRIDATLLPTTLVPDLLQSGAARLLGWVGDETPWQMCGVFVSAKAAADRENVGRILHAYRRGCETYAASLLAKRVDGIVPLDAETRPLLDLLAKHARLPPEQLAKTLPFIRADGRLALDSVQDQIDWMAGSGLVTERFAVRDIVDTGYGYIV